MARARSKCFALDLGSSSVKACELKQTSSGLQLTKFTHINLGIDPSMPAEEKEALKQEGIARAFKAGGFRTKRVMFAVPGQSVFVRNRLLPPVQESRLERIVQYEIQQQIPFPLNQIALDYQVIKRTETKEFDVMMTAIKVDTVDSLAGVVLDSKLKIDAVDVSPVATYNWLRFNEELSKDEGETVACIDIGASTTDIFIERNGEFRFTRSLTVAGNHITEAIKEALSVPFEEAERLKIALGRAPLESEGPLDANTQEGKVATVIGDLLGRLAHEVGRSFGFFRTQSGGSPVARVVLCGGSAALRNIEHFLAQRLEVPVTVGDPFKKLTLAPTAATAQAIPHLLPTCLGLALRSVMPCPLEINLIPPRIVQAEKRKERTVYWGLSFLTLVLIVMAIVPIRYAQHQERLDRLVLLNKEIETYQKYDIERQDLEKKLKQYKMKYDKLNALAGETSTWLPALEALCSALPQGVWLGDISAINYVAPTPGSAAATTRGPAGMRRGGPAMRRGRPGGAGSTRGGRRSRMAGGGRTSLGGRAAGGAIPTRNGLSIAAYAESFDKIEEFEKALKAKEPLFTEVALYEMQVTKVSKQALRQTGVVGAARGGAGGMMPSRMGGRGSSMMGSRGRFGSRGMGRAGMSRTGGPSRGASMMRAGRRTSSMGRIGGGVGYGYQSMEIPAADLAFSFTVDVKIGA